VQLYSSTIAYFDSINYSSSRPSEPVFVIGKGDAPIGDDDYGIVRWDNLTGQEFLIGRFPYRPWAILASLEDKLFLIGGGHWSEPTKMVQSFGTSDARLRLEADLSVGRRSFGVASSRDEILVCGGRGDECKYLSSCEVFQSMRNRWMAMPSLDRASADCQVVWLTDGRVFAIGGYAGGGEYLNSVEMTIREWSSESAAARIWRNVARMLTARYLFAAVAVHGLILVAGGETTGQVNLSSVELFTPPPAADPKALGQWTSMQPMPSSMWCYAGVASGESVFVFDSFSSKIQRFRLSSANAQWSAPAAFSGWNWDEDASLKLLNKWIQPIVLKLSNV